MKDLVKILIEECKDKEYAHAYMDEFFNMSIAAQIKALREQRGWTQKQLAEFSGMKQERISVLEDVDYDAWTVKALRKLANAFDLTVKISFEEFSKAIVDVNNMSQEYLTRTSREEDLAKFSRSKFYDSETMWGQSPVKTVTFNDPQAALFTASACANDSDYKLALAYNDESHKNKYLAVGG
jgi:transcriptional regulator with XRE-family HTH domain